MPKGDTICGKGQKKLCSRGDTIAEIFILPSIKIEKTT